MANVGGRVARPVEALPLDTFEIKPLRVDGSQVRVLDALVLWDKDQDKDQDKEQHKENDL
jgi:hypothetical protein